jgi:DNA-binding CsgD family transcriptional regulator
VFAQASAVLRSAAQPPLLPDTPAALGALAALSSGEAAHAEWVLAQAVATGEGGPVARPRHHLLLAWSAMLGGRFDDARAHHAEALASGRALTPRDELVHRALDVGIARRTNDLAALVRAWPGAREALLRHEVDLFMLLPLGELSVAAARLGQSHALAPQLAAAWDLLDRCGHPVLWSAPMHWYAVHAAVAAERPDGLEPHAAALVQGAQVSRYAALLADAGKAWVQVRAGRVDPAAVQRTGRRLHAAGLGWDASRLAAHAAARTDDQRSASTLMQLARDLHRPGAERPPDAAAPAPATPPAHPPAEPAEAAIHLTEREVEVAQLVLAGHTYREISERLYISTKTVEHHVARMRQRLGLDSRAALLAHLRARLQPAPGA